MQTSWDFVLGGGDPEISRILAGAPTQGPAADRRYTTEEELFFVLPEAYEVPSYPVHHDVDDLSAPAAYLAALRTALGSWVRQVPGLFEGLAWNFDPKGLNRPCFHRILGRGPRLYLVLVRPDLSCRPRRSEVLTPGGNDRTPRFRSRHLFVDLEVLPLARWSRVAGGTGLGLAPLFAATFEGETGRGYFTTGRFIDHEVTRLLNRAALAPGTKAYPHFPLRCRFGTLAVRTAETGRRAQEAAAAALDRAWDLTVPWADRLQAELKADPYREDHPLVGLLREAWGGRLEELGRGYRLEAYLNEQEQKEYRYHGAGN